MNERITLRKKIKSKKPSFLREDWHTKSRIKNTSWRRPKGRHSKMRHGFQGHPACANPGYGGPKDVRGAHKSGLMPVTVCSINDITSLNKSKQAIVIGATVGQKKKIEIVKKASELGFKIIGLKDPGNYLKKIEEEIKSRKAAKKETKDKKKEKVEVKKAEEKKDSAETAEEKKKKETKEFEKVLTKREK